jgi:hypothetical protein
LPPAPRPLFVLGAYPSALHVAWSPQAPYRPIRAIAVDNEPEPFWNGSGELARIEAWKQAVSFEDAWGVVAACGRLNGSSGAWVDTRVLAPLKATRATAWITDCLDAYRCSAGLSARLADTYVPWAQEKGLPLPSLATHPSESEIVREALHGHLTRLKQELAAVAPEVIITLGNAALRVLRALVEVGADADPGRKLSHRRGEYGRPCAVRLTGRLVNWLPLAHPAAPIPYQAAHTRWVEEQR